MEEMDDAFINPAALRARHSQVKSALDAALVAVLRSCNDTMTMVAEQQHCCVFDLDKCLDPALNVITNHDQLFACLLQTLQQRGFYLMADYARRSVFICWAETVEEATQMCYNYRAANRGIGTLGTPAGCAPDPKETVDDSDSDTDV
jgi:hypothetical protein